MSGPGLNTVMLFSPVLQIGTWGETTHRVIFPLVLLQFTRKEGLEVS